jgi:peptidoglycan/LPS O-acetylase OafA/YrhL
MSVNTISDQLKAGSTGTAMKARRHEIRALTGARGVAAVWVMVYHAEAFRQPWSHLRIFIDNGYIAVDLFFILSGYVIALNYGSLFARKFDRPAFGRFLQKRFARTYPLYFVMTFLAFFAGYSGLITFAHWTTQECGLTALVPNLLLIQTWNLPYCSLNSPGWSISTEWVAYLLFPFLCQTVLYSSGLRLWVAAALSIAVLLVLGALPSGWIGETDGWRLGPLAISNGQTLAPVILCVAEFTLGLIAFRLSGLPAAMILKSTNSAGIAIAFVLVVLLCFQGTDILVVLLFVALVISLADDHGPASWILGWAPIYFLGEISYSIYLVHFPILEAVQKLTVGLPHDYRAYAVDALAWASTLGASAGTYYLIENPARRWLTASVR